MGTTLPLLNGKITLEDALTEDSDVLHELSLPPKRLDFWFYLHTQRAQIEDIISRHLGLPRSGFTLGEFGEWVHGSFNACLPIYITASSHRRGLPRRAIIRFALPFKVGEENYPGNVDEKVRCEAATYIWLEKCCPSIPIPRLLGFGFPGGSSFTALGNESVWHRLSWYFRRGLSWLFGPPLTPYVSHHRQHLLEHGYLIIEHVERGQMLSKSWGDHRQDQNKRRNLFRGLSQLMLCLSRHPLPRIGSWTIDDRGVLTLTNRPLTYHLHQLDNWGAPRLMPQHVTYPSADAYYLDLLACHGQQLRHQPNAFHSHSDGEMQLAALAAMRAVLTRFADRQVRNGPFALALTDLHTSNIFVDDEWHITSIIDLEWACARPTEMDGPPYWISNRGLDQLGRHRDEYAALHEEFLDVLEQEERAGYGSSEHSQQLRGCWTGGAYWYFQALDAPGALLAVFLRIIQPMFARFSAAEQDQFDHVVAALWDFGTEEMITAKLQEQKQYEDKIRAAFEAAVTEEGQEGQQQGSPTITQDHQLDR